MLQQTLGETIVVVSCLKTFKCLRTECALRLLPVGWKCSPRGGGC